METESPPDQRDLKRAWQRPHQPAMELPGSLVALLALPYAAAAAAALWWLAAQSAARGTSDQLGACSAALRLETSSTPDASAARPPPPCRRLYADKTHQPAARRERQRTQGAGSGAGPRSASLRCSGINTQAHLCIDSHRPPSCLPCHPQLLASTASSWRETSWCSSSACTLSRAASGARGRSGHARVRTLLL